MENTLDHLGIKIGDYSRSRAFYEKALAPLGIHLVKEFGTVGGFGRGQKPEFWFGESEPHASDSPQRRVSSPVHVCFAARSREEVIAFYQAAIAAGGRDNGAPGLRPIYHSGYYGAFVIDPDGNNVEAAFHGAPAAP